MDVRDSFSVVEYPTRRGGGTVDAAASKAAVRKGMRVRFPPPALVLDSSRGSSRPIRSDDPRGRIRGPESHPRVSAAAPPIRMRVELRAACGRSSLTSAAPRFDSRPRHLCSTHREGRRGRYGRTTLAGVSGGRNLTRASRAAAPPIRMRVELRAACGRSSLTSAAPRFDSRPRHLCSTHREGRRGRYGRTTLAGVSGGRNLTRASRRLRRRSACGWSCGRPAAAPRSPSLRLGSIPAPGTCARLIARVIAADTVGRPSRAYPGAGISPARLGQLRCRSACGWSCGRPAAAPRSRRLRLGSIPAPGTCARLIARVVAADTVGRPSRAYPGAGISPARLGSCAADPHAGGAAGVLRPLLAHARCARGRFPPPALVLDSSRGSSRPIRSDDPRGRIRGPESHPRVSAAAPPIRMRVELRAACGRSSLTSAAPRFDSRPRHLCSTHREGRRGRSVGRPSRAYPGAGISPARLGRLRRRSACGWSCGRPAAAPRSRRLRLGSIPAPGTCARLIARVVAADTVGRPSRAYPGAEFHPRVSAAAPPIRMRVELRASCGRSSLPLAALGVDSRPGTCARLIARVIAADTVGRPSRAYPGAGISPARLGRLRRRSACGWSCGRPAAAPRSRRLRLGSIPAPGTCARLIARVVAADTVGRPSRAYPGAGISPARLGRLRRRSACGWSCGGLRPLLAHVGCASVRFPPPALVLDSSRGSSRPIRSDDPRGVSGGRNLTRASRAAAPPIRMRVELRAACGRSSLTSAAPRFEAPSARWTPAD